MAVIEMSQSKWLVAALVPGVERHPLKKFDAQEEGLLKLLHRWRNEAGQAGREIKRIVVAYVTGEAYALGMVATMAERIPAPVAQSCNHPRRGQAVRSEPPARLRERNRRGEQDPANEDKPASDRRG
jgi:hypothetical protein